MGNCRNTIRAALSHILNHNASGSGSFRWMQDTLYKHTGQLALTQVSSWFLVLRNWLKSPSTRSESPSAISVGINYDDWVSIKLLQAESAAGTTPN